MTAPSPAVSVSFDDIRAARDVARRIALVTPVVPSASFSRLVDGDICLKAENLQRTGSFKIRGALNAVSRLDDPERGVVAASAGNHAQGVALAAKVSGIPATVFMPEAAALPKIAATQAYGADVRLGGANLAEAIDLANAYVGETGARLIHPFDDPAIVAGQGTLGLELVEQVPDLGTVVVPVGGGGLISGVAVALKGHDPSIRIVGVQSAAVPTYLRARATGDLAEIAPSPTVADGIAVSRPSPLCHEIIERHVDDLVAVDDDRTTEAVALLLERGKLLVEPAGAVGAAALLAGLVEPRGRTVVVLSGGNVDLLLLDDVVRHGLATRGRFASIRVLVPDQPGYLASVLTTIGSAGGNILSVEHHREEVGIPFGQVEIHLTMETRSAAHFDEIAGALTDQGVTLHRGGSSSSPG